MRNLIKPDNEAEAIAMQAMLAEHGISAEIASFHDTAYDGLFQAQYGWGMLRVAEPDYTEALRLVTEWREASPGEMPWEDGVTH